MRTEIFERFLVLFESALQSKFDNPNKTIVFAISQTMAEDALVKSICKMKTGSGKSTGSFLGINIVTKMDGEVIIY